MPHHASPPAATVGAASSHPLALLLRVTPNALHGIALARGFNLAVDRQALAARAADLEGRHIGIQIEDTGNHWCFRICRDRLYYVRSEIEDCDVRIRGSLEDFLRLALRLEDPDTLFFHRRLIIEGATETGLAVKNLLDSLDFDLEARLAELPGPAPAKRLAGKAVRSPAAQRVHRLVVRAIAPRDRSESI